MRNHVIVLPCLKISSTSTVQQQLSPAQLDGNLDPPEQEVVLALPAQNPPLGPFQPINHNINVGMVQIMENYIADHNKADFRCNALAVRL